MARELAPAGWRSRPKWADAIFRQIASAGSTTASPPSGSKLPRHRCSFPLCVVPTSASPSPPHSSPPGAMPPSGSGVGGRSGRCPRPRH
ncbi:hypothetical protein DZG01_25410 [Pseudomonas fluorescens]|nr:hypothetical protein DZG01_25410 [Pseudomonas fluorescens]